MPIYLNEYLGFDPKSDGVNKHARSATPVKITEAEAEGLRKPHYTVKIEAMHADFGTRNYTRYTEDCLRGMLSSWTNPYNIPVIMYHNDYDGEIVGRVLEASIEPSTQIRTNALVLNASIPDYLTQSKIDTQLLSTVSIGASGKDVRCSICGAQLSEGEWCEHEKGHVYDGQICYWDIHEAEAKELSFVIVPSDKYAQIVKIQDDWSDGSVVGEPSTSSAPKAESNMYLPSMAEQEHNISIPTNIQIKEQATTSEGKITLDIKEAEEKISSLEKANKALTGDKKSLKENIDSLNTEKIQLQESVEDLKKKIDEKELAVSHEKELREAAEAKIENMQKEVRLSLAESYATLREKAGRAPLEKLEERSIDSLRDSIADLKAELKESKKENDQKKVQEAKGEVKDPSLKESEEKAAEKEPAEESEPDFENFDL